VLDPKVLADVRSAFAADVPSIALGAPVHAGACHPEPLVRMPLAMLTRHGLVSGATGTGKTKSLQLVAEQLSEAGVPVFLADVKGDLSGLAAPGEASERVAARARETGWSWRPTLFPVELLSLTGRRGAQLRATISSFGPLLLAKVLGLNDTQTSALHVIFRYCDERDLELYDLADLRSVLQHLSAAEPAELAEQGGVAKATLGVLLRQLLTLESQGAGGLFGEPEFDLDDLLAVDRDGRGVISLLELDDVQDRPVVFSTFLMWLLARLYGSLPEVGDLERPKLVFFFDEAHLLFDGASRAFLDQVEQVVRLIRSKGVGVFFVTQNPKDLPPDVLGQLGNRVQHALRAFTPEDDEALRAAARTFPKTPHYDVAETLTTLGVGEALASVLAPGGAPTPPFAVRMIPPSSRMGPLTEAERAPRMQTPLVRKYATATDRDSAHEKLAREAEARTRAEEEADERASPQRRSREPEPDRGEEIRRVLDSPVVRTVVREVTRGLMGALLGSARRRSSRRGWF
jgi:hypothetical protein